MSVTDGTSGARGHAVLVARGVSVELGGNRILDEVSLEVRAGEIVALVGPNGAGKSTLLAALAGDLLPVAGSVEVGGRPLGDVGHKQLARERAVLTQEHSVSFPFTVREVTGMGRAPWRGTPAADEDETVIDAALVVTDVTRFEHRAFPTLSGGEKARTSFARVLAQGTGAMLLDEPTAALDVRHQEDVLVQAREAARAGLAVVVVLHDLSLAASYADRVAVLAGGRIVAEGAPAQVFVPATLESVYEYPIDVIVHPRTGQLVVVPLRHVGEQAPASAAVHTENSPLEVDRA